MKRPPHAVVHRTNPRQEAFDQAAGFSPGELRNVKRAHAAAKVAQGRQDVAIEDWRSAYARRKSPGWHEIVACQLRRV
jgi:hypothetical protein